MRNPSPVKERKSEPRLKRFRRSTRPTRATNGPVRTTPSAVQFSPCRLWVGSGIETLSRDCSSTERDRLRSAPQTPQLSSLSALMAPHAGHFCSLRPLNLRSKRVRLYWLLRGMGKVKGRASLVRDSQKGVGPGLSSEPGPWLCADTSEVGADQCEVEDVDYSTLVQIRARIVIGVAHPAAEL
jgi:hypothetical protein